MKNVAIAVTDLSDSVIAFRLTNRSGKLDTPIEIETPNMDSGQSPDTGTIAFTSVNLYARLADYEEINVENLQVFPGTVTAQNLEMIPLSEFPDSWNQIEIFDTPPQDL